MANGRDAWYVCVTIEPDPCGEPSPKSQSHLMSVEVAAAHAAPLRPDGQLPVPLNNAIAPTLGGFGVTVNDGVGVSTGAVTTSPAVRRITVWNAPKFWSPVVASDAITVATSV